MAVTLEEAKTRATKALNYLKAGQLSSNRSYFYTDEARKAIMDLEGRVPCKSRDIYAELVLYLHNQDLVPVIVTVLSWFTACDQEVPYANLSELMRVCTNFTSLCALNDFKLRFVKSRATELLFNISEPSEHLDSDLELTLTIDVLIVLGNCVDHPNSLVRRRYRKCNAVPILMKHLKSTEVMVKIRSLTVLAHIVNDKEIDVIAGTEDCIGHLVDFLKQAVEGDDRWVHSSIGGISYFLGSYGLIDTTNRLVVNDAFKRKIVKYGGVPIIIQILKCEKFGNDTKQCAIEILWKLAFVDRYRKGISRLLTHADAVKVLTEFQDSKNCDLREASTGLLWKLGFIDVLGNSTQQVFRTPHPPYGEPVSDPHIFISYSWCNNDEWVKVLKELGDRFNKAGFPWMDKQKMSGCILKAMATAVKKAAIVLILYSSAYKESVYCQQVADFALICKKPIILLRREYDLTLDGWMAALSTGNALVDIFTDRQIERKVSRVMLEIERLAPMLNEARSKRKAEQQENRNEKEDGQE